MWMVYDNEEGLVGIYNTYEEALKDYEVYKESQEENVQNEGCFHTDERVILAKVNKHFYAYETNEFGVDYDEDGNEIELEEKAWDWKEESY